MIRRLSVLIVAVAAVPGLLAPPAGATATYLSQAWVQQPNIPTGFTSRWDTASAAFPPLAEVVLFGGAPALTGQGWYNDTWIWKGTGGLAGTWTAGPAAPAGLTPRGGMAMAYDPAIAKIVLFGGAGPNDWPPRNETWLFDGTTWTAGPVAPAGLAGRTGAGMVYDDALGKLVLFGGTGVSPYNDTWFFDGTGWTAGPASPAGLQPRAFFGMTYDPGLQKLVVTGGDRDDDTWFFDGTTWTAGPAVLPAAADRERVRLVYDPQLGGDVLFGGASLATGDNELYLLKTGAWSVVSMAATPRPALRMDPQIVWDDTNKQFLVFAGVADDKVTLIDTWVAVAPPVTLTPQSGPVGTVVAVTSGPGWANGSTVHVLFGTTLLKNYTVHADGNVSTTITVPSKPAGQWPVLLSDDTEQLGSTATFTITAFDSSQGGISPGSNAPALSGPVAPPPPATTAAPRRTGASPEGSATGQVSAHDGRFWVGSNPIVLRGLQVDPLPQGATPLALSDYANIESWHFNFVRLLIHWQLFERSPPIHNPDGTWTHNYSPSFMSALKDNISWAAANGLYLMIENGESEEYPPWLLQAPYNSHGITYTDPKQFATDYWSDTLSIQFTQDWLTYLAGQLAGSPGIVGYEAVDEPDPGYLPLTHQTTQTLLDQQLLFAKAVRVVDPNRVMFFMTREVHGDGILNADLSGWNAPGTGLGNVAMDVHDYWGGRAYMPWNMNPTDPGYGELPGGFIDFTLDATGPPYIGTMQNQERFVNAVLGVLGAPGTPGAIPLCMCESGSNWANPNVPAFFGTTTSAFNQLGASWSVEAYNGPIGVEKADGSWQPWLPLLQDAAAYGTTGDVTAPALSYLAIEDTNGNGKVDRVTAKFTETLAAYTAGNAPWTLTGVPSGGSLTSVSVSGSKAVLTLHEGPGAADTSVGGFKVALAAMAGGIADAAGNQASFFALAPFDGAAPAMTTLGMLDRNANGRVDQVVAQFSETLAPSYSGIAAWTLANVPSAGTGLFVKQQGPQALVTVAEGPGPPNTSTTTPNGKFTVALTAMAGGVQDVAGNISSFPATIPADGAPPVVVAVAGGNGDGIMAVGDFLDVTFSEAMGSVVSTTSIGITSPGEGPTQGFDKLAINWVTQQYNTMGSRTYLLGTNVTATFASSTLGFAPGSGNATIRATVAGACTGACGSLTSGVGSLIYVPANTLKDVVGNQVVGSFTTAATFVCF